MTFRCALGAAKMTFRCALGAAKMIFQCTLGAALMKFHFALGADKVQPQSREGCCHRAANRARCHHAATVRPPCGTKNVDLILAVDNTFNVLIYNSILGFISNLVCIVTFTKDTNFLQITST